MKNDNEYASTPAEIDKSLDRAIVVPNFELSPEQIKEFDATHSYKTKSGVVLTDEMIETMGQACERGEYPGVVRKVIVSPVNQPQIFSDLLEDTSDT